MNLEKKTSDLKTLAPNPELVLLDGKNPDILAVQNETHEGIEGVSLPEYIKKTNNGLCVDLSVFPLPKETKYTDQEEQLPEQSFLAFINKVISKGYFFEGLNYKTFITLLYEARIIDAESLKRKQQDGSMLVPFAKEVKLFSSERRSLYKEANLSLNVEGTSASYVFDIPTFPNPDNVWKAIPTEFNIDEFIAFLWGKGIKYGVNEKEVGKVIQDKQTGHVIVAKQLEAKNGVDAKIRTLTDRMERSDVPKISATGRIILAERKNRFPQVEKGVPLIKKDPSKPGMPGRNILGHYIPSPEPLDFNLEGLVGNGTVLEKHSEGDRIIADRGGFVHYDNKDGGLVVYILDAIKNIGGTNPKTTGDLLDLQGDYYEEFGGVTGVNLGGYSFFIKGDVKDASIVSHGGLNETQSVVSVKGDVMNSDLTNENGDIQVESGLIANHPRLRAPKGKIVGGNAENSAFTAKEVRLKNVANGVVIGEKISVESASGNTIFIASESIDIGLLNRLGKGDVRIFRAVPTFSSDEKNEEEIKNSIKKNLDALYAVEQVKIYHGILQKVQSSVQQGKTLTREQGEKLTQMRVDAKKHCEVEKFNEAWQDVDTFKKNTDQLKRSLEELHAIKEKKKNLPKELKCSIKRGGDSIQVISVPLVLNSPEGKNLLEGKTLMDLTHAEMEAWVQRNIPEAWPRLKGKAKVIHR